MTKNGAGVMNTPRKDSLKHIVKPKLFKHWHIVSLWLALYDIIVANIAYFLALWVRFDCRITEISPEYLHAWLKFVPIYSVVVVLVFQAAHLYQSIWRFASYHEFKRVTQATGLTAVIHILLITLLFKRMPISYYFGGPILQFLLVLAIRFGYRFVLLERSKRDKALKNAKAQNVMLIGAGSAGQTILRDMNSRDSQKERVCCIIDDNPNKWHRYIDSVPVVGGRQDIPEAVEKYKIDKIYLCIPSATAAQRRDILEICKGTGCALKNLPGIYQFIDSDISVNSMREVDVEDLLGREPVEVETKEIYSFLAGKTVLVTGGGGSIGSELCRQIAKNNPKLLIVFDIYENNAHAIGLELQDKYPGLNLKILIGSVRDSKRINQVFEQYKPDIVYHAAAHKHVPLMEESPCEAIKNNAVGTYKTAYAAMLNGCKRFVLISTDKAVNPTNVMGASKRICELVIQSMDKMVREGRSSELPEIHMHTADDSLHYKHTERPQTSFVAVRFGNVLGSNGSVIPRFREQIASGGPVTVTHPDIIRYFMTIPEAASLVLQAGTYAKGGEIFILDMGSPVKIDTLARNLICLSGMKPDVDIRIVYTGLRPGEKLYEEKLMAEEGLRKTPNDLIHIGNPVEFDVGAFLPKLNEIMGLAYEGREEDVRRLIAEIVPTFHAPEANQWIPPELLVNGDVQVIN